MSIAKAVSNIKAVTTASKIVNQTAIQVIKQKASGNIYCAPSKFSPNANKLIDGAI